MSARSIIEAYDLFRSAGTRPAQPEIVQPDPVIRWTPRAKRKAEDELLAQIGDSTNRDFSWQRKPVKPKPGVSMTFNKFDYPQKGSGDFSRDYESAKGLEARGLVQVTPLGTATFEVTIL